MKIALLFTGGGFEDPSVFTEKLLAIARKIDGVKIEKRNSDMMGESYFANICPHCNNIFGKMFLHQFYYDTPETEVGLDEYHLGELIDIAKANEL